MLQKEKELFLQLCRFKKPDIERIKYLLESKNATSEVLGTLFDNRVAAIAYGVLQKNGLINMLGREFRNSLQSAYIMNIKRNDDFFACLETISACLEKCGAPYALLKGAYLCGWYPEGYRTSNDIDVLVLPEDVSRFSDCLKKSGFKQGHIKNDKFVPATRQEIIESKMMRGETVPFIKEVNLPFLRFLEVDINFSLDYKNGSTDILTAMLGRTEMRTVASCEIRTLDKYDFLLHLCEHLYKEATTLPWIEMKRDMTFYKYCDIYSLLCEFTSEEIKNLILRAKEISIKDELSYCVHSIMSFYGNISSELKNLVDESEMSLFTHIVSPSEKQIYRYSEAEPLKRFFAKNRIKLLEGV